MLIAQISDMHLVPEGRLAYGVHDTGGALERCVAHLAALEPKPELILATGDLVEDGAAESYRRLRRILSRLAVPVLLLPGNHDDRETLRQTFADYPHIPTSGFIQYAVEDRPVRIVVLDTLVPGRPTGHLCGERLRWLDETLGREPRRPTLIAMHHPPFATGMDYMDRMGLEEAGEFAAVVARHPQVERIVCGHVHRPIVTRFAGTIASVCGSTCHQLALELREGAKPAVVSEPPNYQLHLWRAGHGLVTHFGLIGDYGRAGFG